MHVVLCMLWDALLTSHYHASFLEFYILATSKVISGRAPTCDSANSWGLYNRGPLRDEATRTMTGYPTQSHYPETTPTSHCPTQTMLSAWLGNDTSNFKLLV